MSILKGKSTENIEAMDILINNGKYTPSIHCAYYSCLQLSKHILSQYCSIDYEQQDTESSGRGSHNYIIKELSIQLEKIGRFQKLNYNNNINKLKMLRKISDYNNQTITENEANRAKVMANDIINILNKNYNIWEQKNLF
jgi:uncharacterized protein (UPF0332 family)